MSERASRQKERVVAITILHHPDARRVGDRAFLHGLASQPVPLGSLDPLFASPESGEQAPLGDPFVARRPTTLSAERDGSVRWTRGEHGSGMVAEGLPVASSARFDPAELERGVLLELAQRVVLLLQTRPRSTTEPAPRHGLIGESAAMERVQHAIAEVATRDVPVLVRGASGIDGAQVARAIHVASGRAGAFVTLNVAALSPNMAASELFGHVRGAFTGAARDHDGCFRAAAGGTLFLEEIGDAPSEVQAMLRRTLETGVVHPVGGAPVKASARLVTATDVDLDRAVELGTIDRALARRLSRFEIVLPPLAERREDIGRLSIAYLREELARAAMDDRLSLRDAEAPSWLPPEIVSRLARCEWPGNERQLRNVARQIVHASRDEPRARMDAAVELALAPPAAPPVVLPREPEPAEEARPKRMPSDIGVDELMEVLRACGWKIGPSAERLGISRASLYELIDRAPGIRRASEVTRAELKALIAEVGADVAVLADRLCVSPRGLKLRMKELGLTWRR